MQKNNNLNIILSFIGLWITSILPPSWETILGFVLILTFGIFHGANDILLLQKTLPSSTSNSKVSLFSKYLITVLLSVGLFIYLPVLALFLFIVFSAFHFGEQHWEKKISPNNSFLTKLFYFSYGLFLFFLLFNFHTEEVGNIIASITRHTITSNLILLLLIISAVLCFCFFLSLQLQQPIAWKNLVRELFIIVILTVIFKVASLIWGFAIYFIFWHSIPSLQGQISFIYGKNNWNSQLKYFKNAAPYWLISIVGLGLLYVFFKENDLKYAIFFSFLAAITFPHAFVIHKMFRKKTTPFTEI